MIPFLTRCSLASHKAIPIDLMAPNHPSLLAQPTRETRERREKGTLQAGCQGHEAMTWRRNSVP
jgi:hypothetical protein